jgi:hypothetical protein
MDRHDAWFFLLLGTAFMLVAKRGGRELAEGLREPQDTDQRISRWSRWNTVVWFVIGAGSVVYGTWLLLGLRTG